MSGVTVWSSPAWRAEAVAWVDERLAAACLQRTGEVEQPRVRPWATVLRVPVRDLTGGFKCFHRRVLEKLDLEGVGTDGYGFQIEMTYRALRAGFHVREIPILFRERRVGASKMSARIALEAFWKVPALYFLKH